MSYYASGNGKIVSKTIENNDEIIAKMESVGFSLDCESDKEIDFLFEYSSYRESEIFEVLDEIKGLAESIVFNFSGEGQDSWRIVLEDGNIIEKSKLFLEDIPSDRLLDELINRNYILLTWTKEDVARIAKDNNITLSDEQVDTISSDLYTQFGDNDWICSSISEAIEDAVKSV